MSESLFRQTSPTSPGVYLFKDNQNKVLYVGKARNLNQRLSFYDQKNLLDPKTKALVEQAVEVAWIKTVSEADALILESDLIKRLRPKYNRLLKDDKSYQYLRIGRDLNVGRQKDVINKFPAVSLVRNRQLEPASYFGPFPLGSSIKPILKYLRQVYPFRDCSLTKFRRYQKLGHGCFYFDLNLCGAPCVGAVSSKDYLKNMAGLKRFLNGGSSTIEMRLLKQMKAAAKNLEFEKADQYKKKVEIIDRIKQIRFSPVDYLESPFLAEASRTDEILDLIKLYNQQTKGDLAYHHRFRIEAYDVSHLSGKNATASMVTFIDGEAFKSGYRKFKIKQIKGIDDYSMLQEIVGRRFQHHDWPTPSMILVDGGIGQVRLVEKIVAPLKIPTIGLAKRLERPVVAGRYQLLAHQRPALNLLKRIRDESHRFAKSYHQLLRLKEFRIRE